MRASEQGLDGPAIVAALRAAGFAAAGEHEVEDIGWCGRAGAARRPCAPHERGLPRLARGGREPAPSDRLLHAGTHAEVVLARARPRATLPTAGRLPLCM